MAGMSQELPFMLNTGQHPLTPASVQVDLAMACKQLSGQSLQQPQ